LKKAREINAAEKKQKQAEAEMKLQQQLEDERVAAEEKQKEAEEAMNMAPGPEKRSKGKTPDTKENASPEKTNAEQIRKVRITWIATLTEEELWQIMLTVVRNLESCVAAPIEHIDGIPKCSCGRIYPNMAHFKRHANAHINGNVQCP
jgi:hypothetical protein